MSKKLRYFSFLIFGVCLIIVGWFFVFNVQAGSLETGLNYATQTGLSNQDIRVTIARIIRIILGFLGVISVGLIIYAGFIWMTSKGNEEKINQAKLILRNAVIGLIIILSSFAIVSFILNKLIGATGGLGGEPGSGNNGQGLGSLGAGIVKSVYPEPFQTNVPRNTSIVVTFREPMLAASLCDLLTNDSPKKCAPGAKIKPESIKIFKTLTGDNPATNVTDVAASSNDNQTFVFKPAGPAYLGSPIEALNYTVKLTNDIKKANGDDAFKLSDFYWSFEVNNLLDLVSPQIKNINEAGIFPLPDDEVDAVSGIQPATKAKGSVKVSGSPNVYTAASATVEVIPPAVNATVEGTNTCSDGTITVSINTNGTTASLGYTQSGLLPSTVNIINNKIVISPCGLTLALANNFQAGHSWRIRVTKEKISDTLTVGSKIYTFVSSDPGANQIQLGINNNATASNIAQAIEAIHPEVNASASSSTVTITAKIAGSAGNSIGLSTSNPVALAITSMSGGADETITYTIKDKTDQPKNTVVQINFNEAINPLMISGSSEELADKLRIVNADTQAKTSGQACTKDSDCKSYKCVDNTCEANQLAGNFVVSNQYRTVEFISNIKCGVNGCGESIYCLPANSNLKVEVLAASLIPCTSNNDCTFTPYNTCTQGVCQDQATNKNYPTASILNGVVDLADNSFDGNRNNNPQGQVDFYDENKTITENGGRGDNYLWSFWVSDRLDLTPPKITNTSVGQGAGNVNLVQALEIIFNKIMMSSSLTTGALIINNGTEDIIHHLINLWSLANQPLGYWVSKQDIDFEPLDGKPDRTKAILGHGQFNDSTAYSSQVGSGVKDIYQNCYKPSAGPNCNPTSSLPSCCPDQNGNLVPTANLTPEGNCP